jgi:hypothetical protein
MVYNK